MQLRMSVKSSLPTESAVQPDCGGEPSESGQFLCVLMSHKLVHMLCMCCSMLSIALALSRPIIIAYPLHLMMKAYSCLSELKIFGYNYVYIHMNTQPGCSTQNCCLEWDFNQQPSAFSANVLPTDKQLSSRHS